MAVTQRTKDILAEALADQVAAADLLSNGSLAAQSLDTTDSPTFVALTTTGNATVGGNLAVTGTAAVGGNLTASGHILLASAKVLKVNSVQVVGAQQSAITNATFTATTGSLPTADGALTVSDATSPTVAELLEGLVELRAKLGSVITALHNHGLIG